MTEEAALDKAKKYLVRLKNGKQIKKTELNDLKIVIEELDSISYKIKEWKEIENDYRKV